MTQTNAFGDAVTVTTNVLNPPHTVPLNQTAQGAILTYSPAALDFGNVPINTTGMSTFQIVNTGNATANVVLSVDNAVFGVPTGVTVVAGNAGLIQCQLLAGPHDRPGARRFVDAGAADVYCAPLPSPLSLVGTGTNGSVVYLRAH